MTELEKYLIFKASQWHYAHMSAMYSEAAAMLYKNMPYEFQLECRNVAAVLNTIASFAKLTTKKRRTSPYGDVSDIWGELPTW
jgi:hypothetical protein